MNTFVTDNITALAPVGSYMHLHQTGTRVETVVNTGWLECNGFAVSRAVYSALFALVGTTYGAGDTTTTFNLPDLAGRAIIAMAGAGGSTVVDSLGKSDGAALADRSPSHHHRYLPPQVIGGYSGSGYGVKRDTQEKTTGNQQLQDTPAFLVAGVWLIKF